MSRMQLVVFEDTGFRDLLPLVYSRATFDLRCGCDTLLDKIETAVGRRADALFVRASLADVVDERQRTEAAGPRAVNRAPDGEDQLWVNGRLLVRDRIELPSGSAVWSGKTLLAARVDQGTAAGLTPGDTAALQRALASLKRVDLSGDTALLIRYPWQLVHANEAEIVRQASGMARGRAGRIDPGAYLLQEEDICIGAGSRIKPGAVVDAEAGPIRIGRQVTVGPTATITGPCVIGDGCLIRPGASISGSSIGPVCKVGGEVEVTILHGFSNKQHDGFLGHSYVGEWVNLGADTVNSDLKNTYGPVRVPINGRDVDSGEQFVGAFIGDHTKTGINVTLPTGCVIGFACSLFVSRTPPKFVPSFTWLTDDGAQRNDSDKALAVAATVWARRGRSLSEAERALFLSIAEAAGRMETG